MDARTSIGPSTCSQADIEFASEMSYKMMKDFGASEELLASVASAVAALGEVLNEHAIGSCLQVYIGSELDIETAGERGLGRASTYVPRLGAYYRKKIGEMPDDDIENLFLLIRNMMLQAYIAHATMEFLEYGSLMEAAVERDQELYERWIPIIYTANLDDLEQFIGNFTYSGWEKIKDVFEIHNMKTGDRKVKEILSYYMFAGFCLRMVEVSK